LHTKIVANFDKKIKLKRAMISDKHCKIQQEKYQQEYTPKETVLKNFITFCFSF